MNFSYSPPPPHRQNPVTGEKTTNGGICHRQLLKIKKSIKKYGENWFKSNYDLVYTECNHFNSNF
jgi:hypothetical protein